MERIKILNNFNKTIVYPSGGNANTEDSVKTIAIPIKMEYNPMDYTELIDQLLKDEIEKSINLINDKETIKFNNSELELKLYFYNETTGVWGNDFLSAGFTQQQITTKRPALTRSFFRLDFFDSNDEQKQNLIYSEFIEVRDSNTPTIPLKKLFWFKKDVNFLKNQNRKIYFNIRFYNASTGKIVRFLNGPIQNPLTIEDYNVNFLWRFAGLEFINPFINKDRIFMVDNTLNGNTNSNISFKELKMI